MSDKSITVILNAYKREVFLEEQIKAIKNQSVKVDKIMIWQNGNYFNISVDDDITTVKSSDNLGVWARFTLALNCKTKYIAIFDDDTIPGRKWLENCLNTIQINRGLLGTVGLVYNSPNSYFPNTRYGWADINNESVKQVDIVGHCWFFERDWLSVYFKELPPVDMTTVGEDMHFSFMLQKYLNINTFVPPHPSNDMEMWGSIKGWQYGTEPNALSFNNNNIIMMDSYLKTIIKNGFKLINYGK